jgi:hypothetical protein
MGLVVVDGGRKRLDARARGAAPPLGKGFFLIDDWFYSLRSTEVGTRLDFKVGGARAVGGMIFKILEHAPCCVYCAVSL